MSITPYLHESTPDCFCWKEQTDGRYTAKAGYIWHTKQQIITNTLPETTWTWIWHNHFPEKAKILIWTACHDSLPSASLLHHRGMLDSPICTRCSAPIEDILHILRDCPHSSSIWHDLQVKDSHFYTNMSTINWLKEGTKSRFANLFVAGIWWLWRARNSHCIADDPIPSYKLLLEIHSLARDISLVSTSHSSSTATRWITWHPAKDDSYVLNVDGSSLGNPGNVGIGGVIRDKDGNWVIGFAGYIGVQDNLFAELLALNHGLKLACHLQIQKLTVYCDSTWTIQLPTNPPPPFHLYASTIQQIRDLLANQWDVQLRHTLREGNRAADHLAKIGASSASSWIEFRAPPEALSSILSSDALRVMIPRS